MMTYFKGIGLLSALFFLFSFSPQSFNNHSANKFTEAKIRVDADGTTPLEIRFPEGRGISVMLFFEEYKRKYRLSDDNQLKSFRVFTDAIGQTHHRMRQTYKGIELAEVQHLLPEEDNPVFYAHESK
jgi:Zn-dependent metalloprotease